MSDQMMPPQVPPPDSDGQAPIDVEDVRTRLLVAIKTSADLGAATGIAQAADDAAKAALNFSQAYVLLDPMMTGDGTDIRAEQEHEARMGELQGEQQERAFKARSAAAPTPVKGLRRRRSVNARRDRHGRLEGMDVEDRED